MSKKILGVLFACVSISAHAESVLLHSTFCHTVPKENLGQCIQNQTGKTITGDLNLIQETFYTDGKSSVYRFGLDGFQPGNYIDVSLSTKYLVDKKITMIDFTLTKDNIPVSGCSFKIAPSLYPNKPVLAIKEKNGQLSC